MEPSHLEGYPVCAYDWSGKRGVFWTTDGKTTQHSVDLMEMLDMLQQQQFRITGEPMFESFGTHNARDAFVEECLGLDHVLQRASSRMTHWLRERKHFEAGHGGIGNETGLGIGLSKAEKKAASLAECKEEMCQKTDELDCLRIWELAHTVHCSIVKLHSDLNEIEFKERSEALNTEAMVLRKSGLKDELLESIMEAIPVEELPDRIKDYASKRMDWWDGEGSQDSPGWYRAWTGLERDQKISLWTKSFLESLTTKKDGRVVYRCGVPSIWLAARETKNRDDFEKLLGLHGNGKSCQLRSDIYNWMWKFLRVAAIKKATADGVDVTTFVKMRRSKFRNDVRTFRHMLLANPPKIGGLEDLI